MKLSSEIIDKCLKDFKYELTKEQLENDWFIDTSKPFTSIKDCINLRSKDNCWLELPINDYLKIKSNLDSSYINYGEVLQSVQSIIDLMYNSNFDPTINYLEEFNKHLFEMRD
jgi:hypothetical protein